MRARLAAQDGFTLIELLAALLLLTVGIFAVATTFDFSRASTNQSELKTSAIDRAQREIEAIRSLPYEQVAHPTGGILAASSDPADPTSRIAGASFKWNPANPSATEPLAVAATGEVPMKQEIAKGDDDRFGYTIWRFVTVTEEPACAAAVECADGGDEYRRVTVVVRARGLGDTMSPVWTSTTVIDPSLAANNDGQPQTLCHDEDGSELELCSVEGEGQPLRYHLTNTRANTGNERQAVPGDPAQRPLHKTVKVPGTCTAGNSTGCPIPDLMVETGLPQLESDDPVPPLLSFATDLEPPGLDAGRPLLQDAVACGGAPSKNDDLKGAYWVSPPLAEDVELIGDGTLRLYSRTWTAADHLVDLCGVVYSVPNAIANPVASPPTEIGRFSERYRWPGTTMPISLDAGLDFTPPFVDDPAVVAANRRIGLRLWIADSSGDDVVLLYDHPNHESALTLLAKEDD